MPAAAARARARAPRPIVEHGLCPSRRRGLGSRRRPAGLPLKHVQACLGSIPFLEHIFVGAKRLGGHLTNLAPPGARSQFAQIRGLLRHKMAKALQQRLAALERPGGLRVGG